MPSKDPIDVSLKRLRQRVFDRKPILSHIIAKLGKKTLCEYVGGYKDVTIHPSMKARQGEFLSVYQDEVARLTDPDTALKARKQLERSFFVSTNDHHGPLNAFDMFNAHLVLALRAMDPSDREDMDVINVLSCGSVSLNNITFPRGLLYHTKAGNDVHEERLALLPSNAHARPQYGFRAFGSQDLKKLDTLLRQRVRDDDLPLSIAEKLRALLTDVFGGPEILSLSSYAEQVTMANDKLWKRVFSSRSRAPVLVFLEQESFIARLLITHHLGRRTFLDRFLFDADYESLIRKYFDGIYGAFSTKDDTGTYLFWGMPVDAKFRVRMRKEGDALVASDGSLRIPWTPEAIAEALQKKQLMPSILLVFVALSFYHGLKCLGGYSQVNYLTLMKEAFTAMMRDLGENEAADACIELSTKNWSGFTFSYLADGHGGVLPAHFLDIYLYGDDAMWQDLSEYGHSCTLETAIQPLLPEMYRYSYRENEREEDLIALTPEEIAVACGIRPCIQLSPRNTEALCYTPGRDRLSQRSADASRKGTHLTAR